MGEYVCPPLLAKRLRQAWDKVGDTMGKKCGYQHKKISDFFTTKVLTGSIHVRWGVSNLKSIINKKNYLVINLYTDYYYNY